MKGKLFLLAALFLLLGACTAQPKTIVETVIQEATVEVLQTVEIEVTRQVEVTVEVTRQVEVTKEVPVEVTKIVEVVITATPESAAAHAGSRESTGVPELDLLVEVILSNDLAARRELVHYTTAGCTNADGLGGPPKCQPNQSEGAPVDYLPVMGPGEGVPVLPEAIDGSLDFPAEELYAVYRRADEPVRDVYYRPGEYGLFFATGEGESNIQFVLVHADMAGRIVRLDYLACPVNAAGEIIEMPGLACSPEQIMARDAADFVGAVEEACRFINKLAIYILHRRT